MGGEGGRSVVRCWAGGVLMAPSLEPGPKGSSLPKAKTEPLASTGINASEQILGEAYKMLSHFA